MLADQVSRTQAEALARRIAAWRDVAAVDLLEAPQRTPEPEKATGPRTGADALLDELLGEDRYVSAKHAGREARRRGISEDQMRGARERQGLMSIKGKRRFGRGGEWLWIDPDAWDVHPHNMPRVLPGRGRVFTLPSAAGWQDRLKQARDELQESLRRKGDRGRR